MDSSHQQSEQELDPIALYGRISRANGRDAEELERHTKSEQREHAVGLLPRSCALVEREQWWDVNVSGSNFDRPGLARVFEAVAAGEVRGIAVGYLSRFGRNARELLDNLHRLHELGGTLYVGKERIIARPDRNDPMGRLLITILAAMAELELTRLSEQLGRANRTAKANGVSIQVPYGYRRINGPGSILEPDLDGEHLPSGWTPASVVRYIFALRADGTGDTAIADALNAEGIPTPTHLEHLRGTRRQSGAVLWKHNTVKNIATTHTYRGVIPEGIQFEGEGRRRRAVAWRYLPGAHEALVDAALFEAAQRKEERAVRTGRIGGSLLQGLVRCAHCSQTMKPTTGGGGHGASVLVYKCRGKRAGCTRPASSVREPLEELVVERLLGGALELDIEERDNLDKLIADARVELDFAVQELAAFDLHASAAELGDQFMPQRNRRAADVAEAERRLAGMLASTREAERRRLEQWSELSLADRREVLGQLLDAVVVEQGSRDALIARVHLIGAGRAPFELSGTGRTVAPRPWPL
jgi:DNA invertase Pin-like site-specific DNA recombinase